ncbi:MAG: hypothetical protein GTO41_06895 [Burkholderiales bacterium]|nr:hypothetical protein [Burkholderiales bacterium]
MGEIVNPAIAGIRREQKTDIANLRAKVDAWSARNDPRNYRGSLRDLAALVPGFERRGVTKQDQIAVGANGGADDCAHLDVVLRRAGPGVGLLEMPVGVVNRRHQLVPHARVIENLERALGVVRADPAHAEAELDLTNFGARMFLDVSLPKCFEFDPGDGQSLALRALVYNSVNGGGLRLQLVWKQLESGSEFAGGVTRLESRVGHRMPARLNELVPSLQRAVETAAAERTALAAWHTNLVTRDQLVNWVDGSIRRMWGRSAAARVFHIAMTGWDAEPAYSFEKVAPSRRTMQATDPVPCAPAFVETVYDALLGLAWVARDARDSNERFDRIAETTVLMRALLRPTVH